MKKIKFSGKLSLNKETVSKLNQEQMTRVIGGSVRCASAAPNCPDTTQANCVTFVDSCGCSTDTFCPTDVCLTTMRNGGPC